MKDGQHPLSPLRAEYQGQGLGSAPRPSRARGDAALAWASCSMRLTPTCVPPQRCATRSHIAISSRSARLTAHGFATGAKKRSRAGSRARCRSSWPTRSIRQELDLSARQMVLSATDVADALAKRCGPAKGPRARVAAALWAGLETPFLAALRAVPAALEKDGDDPTLAIREDWARRLRRTAYELFGNACPLDHDPKGVTAARQALATKMQRACTTQLALSGGTNGATK